jgi:DNA-binding protein HU-beta
MLHCAGAFGGNSGGKSLEGEAQRAATIFCSKPANLITVASLAHYAPEGKHPMQKSKQFTTSQLAAALSTQHELTKKQSREMLKDLTGMIAKHLKDGERVKITGLGILQVRHRSARMGRNPATGEPIQIKASKKVAFRATKELKMAI